jgi:hypothetical protein
MPKVCKPAEIDLSNAFPKTAVRANRYRYGRTARPVVAFRACGLFELGRLIFFAHWAIKFVIWRSGIAVEIRYYPVTVIAEN